MHDPTDPTPLAPAVRLQRWLEGYRILANGRSLDAEEAHHAWVNQEAAPRTLHVSDVAAVLAAFNELADALADPAVSIVADDSAVFERGERAIQAAREALGR